MTNNNVPRFCHSNSYSCKMTALSESNQTCSLLHICDTNTAKKKINVYLKPPYSVQNVLSGCDFYVIQCAVFY